MVSGFTIREHDLGDVAPALWDLSGALQVSSNIYFAHVGLELGADRYLDYARRFGFCQGLRIGSDFRGLPVDPSYVSAQADGGCAPFKRRGGARQRRVRAGRRLGHAPADGAAGRDDRQRWRRSATVRGPRPAQPRGDARRRADARACSRHTTADAAIRRSRRGGRAGAPGDDRRRVRADRAAVRGRGRRDPLRHLGRPDRRQDRDRGARPGPQAALVVHRLRPGPGRRPAGRSRSRSSSRAAEAARGTRRRSAAR